MKKIIFNIILILSTANIFAQKLGANYQAVVLDRKKSGNFTKVFNYLPNTTMIVKFTLFDNYNQLVYQEEHLTKTDANGVLSVVFGRGVPTKESPYHIVDDAFERTNLDGNPLKLRVEIATGRDLRRFITIDNQELFFVPFAKHKNITAKGNMKIEEVTNLNNELEVINEAKTHLTGDLIVKKQTNVKQITSNNIAKFEKSLTIKDISDDDYLMKIDTIDENNGGIMININHESNSSISFVSFKDKYWDIGSIKGNSAADVWQDPEFLYNFVYYIAKNILQGFCIALAATQAAASGAATFGAKVKWAKMVIEILNQVMLIAETVLYNVMSFQNLGVAYTSANGDYAEWLPLLDESENIYKGEVVGVYGGKISKNITNADHILVVTHNPAVKGNNPLNQIEQEKGRYVAFLGQVPVWTVGKVNLGDYIVAFDDGSGLAIAVSPQDLTIQQSRKIIGKAMSSHQYEGKKLVNTLVGYKTYDEYAFVKQTDDKLNVIEDKKTQIDYKLQQRNQLLNEILPNYQIIYNQQKAIFNNSIVK